MASLQQLSDDVQGWLNRRDVASLIPGWVSMVETEIAQTLRARCMVTSGVQSLDAAYINLPANFAAMESIRDAVSGEMLILNDEWSGHWTSKYSNAWVSGAVVPTVQCSTRYRIVADCIEWLPHPIVPDPPNPFWVPQQVLMGWYAKPTPLILPSDTNAVLENLYGVYLWGILKMGALFELDDARAAQADAQFQQAVTRADLWKQQSDYSGAPYREEMAVQF